MDRFIATLRAGASWLFFRVARSTGMTQIWAPLPPVRLGPCLEKQPSDLRQNTSYFGDKTLQSRVLILVAGVCFGTVAAHAWNATWRVNPGSTDWNTAANWTPVLVPTGTATFGASHTTKITFSMNASVGTLLFNTGAPAYSFTLSGVSLTINEAGIVNDSSNAPAFTVSAPACSTAALTFMGGSSAADAAITSNSGGETVFSNTSTGGNARFITNAGGIFDISGLTSGGMTAGSIEGAGAYQLGSKALTVGLNNFSTDVSGTIADGGLYGGAHSSLIKVGTGTLTLAGLNTYSGGTNFDGGAIAVSSDSNLGTGRLSFNGGTLEALATRGGIESSKTITLNGAGGTFLADLFSISTLTGTIRGVGALNLEGPGTLGLPGTNTYRGGTVLSGDATLFVYRDAALGATGAGIGGITLQGGTLVNAGGFSSARAISLRPAASGDVLAGGGKYTGVISGAGALLVNNFDDPGILVLTANNTYSGGTTIFPETLVAAANHALGSGPVQISSGNLMILAGVTLPNEVNFGQGILNNAGTLNNNVLGATASGGFETVINSGSINGNVLLGGDGDTVQLFTGSRISGNLSLSGVSNATGAPRSTLILDGAGQQLLSLAVTGSATNNGTLVKQGGGVWTIDRAIAAPLGTNILAGTLVLDAALTTPQVNISTGATLQLEKVGTAGNLVDDGSVILAPSTALNSSGIISGSGYVIQAASGITTLSGTNTYSGGTIFNGGAIAVTSDSNLGTGSLTFNGGTLEALATRGGIESGKAITLNPGGGTFLADLFSISTLTGTISGVGALNVEGPGTLGLQGINTYRGGTVLAGDVTLFAFSAASLGATGAGIGGITLQGGTLVTVGGFSTTRAIELRPASTGDVLTGNGTFTGVISGAGALMVNNLEYGGTIVLMANNTYSGGTDVFPEFLVAAANHALGSGPVQMFSGNLMIRAGVTLPNEVNFGEGVLNNAGTLNNNVLGATAAGEFETVINSGTINGNVLLGGDGDTVQLFAGSTINGNLSLSATARFGGAPRSTLILDGAGQQLLSLSVTGAVTNNGTLIKQGSGVWTIDRALAAPLVTNILAGTLVLDAALATPQVNISAGATLQLEKVGTAANLANAGSVTLAPSVALNASGIISGSGDVIQAGPGTTTLSGTNTYSGGTVINLGTLIVDNAQALGTGNVTVNGGILKADPLPINVLGNYTQNAGGTLQVQVAGANPGQYDSLNVGGNAGLGGTLQLISLGFQPKAGNQLSLITTGGMVSGRFAHFVDPFAAGPDFNTVELVYGRNSVLLEFLNLARPFQSVLVATDFSSFAATPLENAAATLLDAVQLDPRAAQLISFFSKEPLANLPTDFQKISPEGLTAFAEISFSSANIQRLNLEARLDDLHSGSNGFSSNMKVGGATVNLEDRADTDSKSSKSVVEPILEPGPGNRWGVWVTGFGDFVSVDADANATGYDFAIGGVSLGIDYRITDQLAIGVMGDYSHTWTALQPGGHIDVDSGRGGLYATWCNHGLYLNGAIYGGHNTDDSSRSGLGGLATGGTEGAEWSAFISGGYDFHVGPLTAGPIASLQYTDVHVHGFSEKGSLAPLEIHSDSAESLRSDVGFRIFCQWRIGKIALAPSLKATWEHEYNYSALPIAAGFAGIPASSATFFGPSEGHDSAVVSAGLSAQVTPAFTVYLNYDGQLARDNYDSNAVTGGLRISF